MTDGVEEGERFEGSDLVREEVCFFSLSRLVAVPLRLNCLASVMAVLLDDGADGVDEVVDALEDGLSNVDDRFDGVEERAAEDEDVLANG